MGLGQTIQNWSQIGRPRAPGWEAITSRVAGDRSQGSEPSGVRTPEEALACIRLFSEAGRTAELAALLRSSPVLREAWQTLQQFSSGGSGTGLGESAAEPTAPQARRHAAPPSPADAGSQSQGPPALLVAAASGGSRENPLTQAYPVLSSRPTRPLAAARQAYETTDRLLTREGAASPRISLRV